jgi:hypothetical protein
VHNKDSVIETDDMAALESARDGYLAEEYDDSLSGEELDEAASDDRMLTGSHALDKQLLAAKLHELKIVRARCDGDITALERVLAIM